MRGVIHGGAHHVLRVAVTVAPEDEDGAEFSADAATPAMQIQSQSQGQSQSQSQSQPPSERLP
jgi:hypothetical protein